MPNENTIKIFIAYSREDAAILQKLRTNLKVLERTQKVQVWYDGEIEVGADWAKTIKSHLHSADIILLLISENFIASDYCYDQEMTEALSLHDQEKVRAIPVIAKECLWQDTPFARLQALPEDGKPLTSKDWSNPNRPYLQVVQELKNVMKDIRGKRQAANTAQQQSRIQQQQLANQRSKFQNFISKGEQHFQKEEWQRAAAQFQSATGIYNAGFGGMPLQQLQQKIQNCNREMGYRNAYQEAQLDFSKGNYKGATQHLEAALKLKNTSEAQQLLTNVKNEIAEQRNASFDKVLKNKGFLIGLPAILVLLLGVWGISKIWNGSPNTKNDPIEESLTSLGNDDNLNKVNEEEESKKEPKEVEKTTAPKLDPEIQAQQTYDSLVSRGNNYFNVKKYERAKSKYEAALAAGKGFKFSTKEAEEGIKNCDEKIKQQEKQQGYKKYLDAGDTAFKNGDYKKAKGYFETAQVQINTTEIKKRIAACNEKLKPKPKRPEAEIINRKLQDNRDGQTYKIAKLKDGKIWMAENLNFKMTESYCYDDKPFNCDKYGRLYIWKAAMKACPNGWHLPTKKEWDNLVEKYGGLGGASYKALTTNDFTALPGGYGGSDGEFGGLGSLGYYWSAAERNAVNAWYYFFYKGSGGVSRYDNNKPYAFSCRCVKD